MTAVNHSRDLDEIVNQILARFEALTQLPGWTAEIGDTSLLLNARVPDLETGRRIVAGIAAQFGESRFDRFRVLALEEGEGAKVEIFGAIRKIADAINLSLPQAPVELPESLAA